MERQLLNLGRELGRAQDERLRDSLDHEGGRARLVRSMEPKPRRWVVPGLGAAAFALAAFAALWLSASTPLEFRVGGGTGPVELGQRLRAPSNAGLDVRFTDGTKLELLGGTEASVVRTDSRGATVRVEQGTLRASVVHREDTSWRIEAGPFVVDVIGTRFEAEWQQQTERFSLRLKEGAVTVSGPVVGTKRTVRAGETLNVSCREGELALVRGGAEPERSLKPATSDSARDAGIPESSEVGPKPASSSSSRPTSGAPPVVPDYRGLARSNEYERALRAAERAGFDELCRTASADDLLVLGDAARLAGSPGRAEQAYRAVRDRFAGANAARAGFLLGRLAFDGRGAYGEAARYFALSLLEEPNGSFSRDASGRLVESLDRSGDATGAKAAAERYLERYPEGPHANLARTLLARP
jgi:TolA-binding protein